MTYAYSCRALFLANHLPGNIAWSKHTFPLVQNARKSNYRKSTNALNCIEINCYIFKCLICLYYNLGLICFKVQNIEQTAIFQNKPTGNAIA